MTQEPIKFGDINLLSGIRDNIEKFMKTKGAIALSANQMDLEMNYMAVSYYPSGLRTREPHILHMLAPEMLYASGKLLGGVETSVTMPGERFRVMRHNKVKFTYVDHRGAKCGRTFKGFNARVVMHCFEALQGKTLDTVGEKITK